jgi:acyl transferase domain-containing protein/acyl carrier protein
VISGTEEAVEEVRSAWEDKGRKTKRLAVSHAFHSPLMEPMLEQFAAVAQSLAYSEPKIPIVSNLTGEVLDASEATDPAYWVSHVRQPVRFAAAVDTLQAQGASAYLELGPDPVLCAMARDCLAGEDTEAAFVPTLREGRSEADVATRAIAHAYAAGAALEWGAFFAQSGAKRVPLPTYPFQHKRYWLAAIAATGDASAIGLTAAEHPLLGAAVDLPGGNDDGLLLTGRLSLQTHPWLADHAFAGTVLLPGTAFLELALQAGDRVGAETVEELALQAPLVLPEAGAVAIQVSVSSSGEDGRREVSVHSRPESKGGEWAHNASGVLSQQRIPSPKHLDSWPPEGADPIEVEYLYDLLSEQGLECGPAFQGLDALWRDGEQIYAEVSLPSEVAHDAERFGIHPALLESALRGAGTTSEGSGAVELPALWSRVALHAVGARELRVAIAPAEGEGVSLEVADPTGAPVASVAKLVSRPLDSTQLQGTGQGEEGLLGLEWAEVALAEQTAGPPEVELLHIDGGVEGPDIAEAARKAAQNALKAIQRWIHDESKGDSRLALVTPGAMATTAEETADPVAAAIWGLVRSAQSEHPGRFALIDSDGTDASEAALPAALAVGAEEPQLALREGRALAPRLARIDAGEAPEGVVPAIDPERTVLITGATGGLGALVARHLAEQRGARHLLLVSRSGPEAEGAGELQAELEGLGAETRIVACDVSDLEALGKLLASISAEHPLGAAIHCAGAIADGTVENLGPEQIEQVFAPKVEGATNLHELTRDLDLSAFVLFSSVAGTLGGAGQANYAAANVFLDALAQRRKAEGLPATSIAWGLWERASGMASELGDADLARMRRGGIEALSDERGLALFDLALGADRPQVVALPLDVAGLRVLASAGALPPIFAGLVRVSRRRASSGSLAAKLAALPEAERGSHVLDLVRTRIAAMLGYASAQEVEPDRAFQELGFDSLAAVELRNQLDAISGLRLPATVVFDHPSAAALAGYLLTEVVSSGGGGTTSESKEAEIREALASIPLSRLRRSGLIDSLMRLADSGDDGEIEPDDSDLIDSMGIEDLIRKSAEGLPSESGEEGGA